MKPTIHTPPKAWLHRLATMALLLTLAACGTASRPTADVTVIQPLSKVEWAERIAANRAAVVSNNNLILMR